MKVILSKQAGKVLQSQDKSTKIRIIEATEGIPAGDIKPLKGTPDTYRLRVGGWRILFSYIVIDDGEAVFIEKIAPRGDVYKGV